MATSKGVISDAMAAGKFTELRQRLFFLLGAIIVFRIGSFITVPGLDSGELEKLFDQNSDNIIGFMNMFGGGALSRLSLFALGIMPYISSSIIMQLLTKVHPKLEQLSKEGAAGRRKITQYTRMLTLVLAMLQSYGIANYMLSQGSLVLPNMQANEFTFIFTTMVTLVTGTMFLMWLGEQITERGIGNGISIIIFAGIVSGMPGAIYNTFSEVSSGSRHITFIFGLAAMMFLVIMFVVFMERAQRRITVNYAKRQQGRKMYAAQSSHLPLKINMAGVIPPIFASSLILFPATFFQFIGSSNEGGMMQDIAQMLAPGKPLYILFYGLLILFFCYFYTALMFNPKETADNLKRQGAFIPGIRPGEQTARYIDTILGRLTLVGALYITAVCLLPEFMVLFADSQLYFGGTSLLIIVVVVMDFMAQLQSHLMQHQYGGMMEKANLKGHGGAGGGMLR